jgi:hypothetical protein
VNKHNVSIIVTCQCLRWLTRIPTVDDGDISSPPVSWTDLSSSSWKILWVVAVTSLCSHVSQLSYMHWMCLYAVWCPCLRYLLARLWLHSREAKGCSKNTSKVVKDQCEIIQDPISRKWIKILTTHMGEHNEIIISPIEDACLYSLSCLSLGLHVQFQSRSTLTCIIS